MKRLVVDASVAIKWLVPTLPEEADVDQALALITQVELGNIILYQPPHFVSEVMGVIARISPEEAFGILGDLLNTPFFSEENSAIYTAATELSIRFNHHLFDTLYHAVALQIPGATLVTADQRYYDKAKYEGQIILLQDLILST